MKVALVTTPLGVRSGIGDYTRHLLPYLREHCDVELFAESTADEDEIRSVHELRPGDYDQVLFQLGNEARHGFMARMVRAIGGTVMQHDWVLFDLAMAAFPALVRGGLKGHALALREGGLEQARLYWRNWLDRREQRLRPVVTELGGPREGTILCGWHGPERTGRWTTDQAAVRIPSDDVEVVELDVHVESGRSLRVLQDGRVLFEGGGGVHRFRPTEVDHPVLTLETSGIRVSREQRRNGDSRRLGVCVRRLSWTAEGETRDLDLSRPSARFEPEVSLSRDRFLLPLNRSVVRFADAFLVHSEYVRDRILAERNATTAIGIVHHGAEARWRDEDRREARGRLGLDAAWRDSFLVTSFGGVQPHKRIDKALEALARARRERDDVRMVLVGAMSGEHFDPRSFASELGIRDAVRFTGFVPEETAWDWLHAGDLALNLRGPSSGGTSGGIFQAFSMARPVLASDAAEQRELPDSCVVKIPVGEGEVQTLARTLVELRDDPVRRNELERNVRRFVERECHWDVVARRYVELLEGFPRPRTSRRKLIAMRTSLLTR